MKLNIGGGATQLDGFTVVDRKQGQEAFPLKYADDSVEEIRASHILEHFNFSDARQALQDWVRVLAPGGVIKIAVPDFDKIAERRGTDRLWRHYLMGGQIDANDQHLTVWDAATLRAEMEFAGLQDVKSWETDGKDTSAHPVSLNLQGRKVASSTIQDAACPPGKKRAKIAAVLSCPRLGWNDFWGEAIAALSDRGIPLRRFTGAFWDQCIQNAFEDAIKEGLDFLITLDYDSLFTAKHVDRLLQTMANNPDMDAIAGLQCRRVSQFPLLTIPGQKSMKVDAEKFEPIKVTTAHFGLTVIRLSSLVDIPKPWFCGKPDSTGSWRGDDRLDADIWFWHQWRLHGRSVFVDPGCKVGHMEVLVSTFDEEMKAKHVHVKDWREMQFKDEQAMFRGEA